MSITLAGNLSAFATSGTLTRASGNNATITAGGFMIYNAFEDNSVLFVGSWGANYSSTNGPFTVNIADDQITFS